MTEQIIMEGDYCDLKFVKGRKVAVIWIEIPIEAADEFVKGFGTPLPDRNVPVAVARLVKKEERSAELKQQLKDSVKQGTRSWSELSRAQQAGITCNERGFWGFLERDGGSCGSEEEAAELVRIICARPDDTAPLGSRKELNSDPVAGQRWDDLYSRYQVWLRIPSA